ncbi:hypothetical protein GQ457_11G022550 [Hibiscus cannabinus]
MPLNFIALVEQLEKVIVSEMEYKAQIGFWINVYNALIMHAAYNISGHIIKTILYTTLRKKSYEEGNLSVQNLVFHIPNHLPALLYIKVYTESNVKEELEVAKREFLQANVVVKKSKKVFLPRVLERFAKEASISSNEILNWVTDNVDKKLHNSIQKCIDGKSKKKKSHVIDRLPYNSSFRYIFSKDLTEKPW